MNRIAQANVQVKNNMSKLFTTIAKWEKQANYLQTICISKNIHISTNIYTLVRYYAATAKVSFPYFAMQHKYNHYDFVSTL